MRIHEAGAHAILASASLMVPTIRQLQEKLSRHRPRVLVPDKAPDGDLTPLTLVGNVHYAILLHFLLSHYPSPGPRCSLLEIGCLYGLFLDYLGGHSNYDVHGIDLNQDAVDAARRADLNARVVDARWLSSEYSPETFDASFAINLFVTPSLQKDGVEYLLMPADRGGYHVFRDDTRSRVATVRSDRDLSRAGFSTDDVERFETTFQQWFRREGDAVGNSLAADERIAAIFAGVRSVLRPDAAFFCNAEIDLPIERIGALGFQIRHTFERVRDGRFSRYWVFAIDPDA